MMNFIRDYRTKPWPKLEIPTMRRQHTYFFVAYVIALVALGWFIWFSGNIQIENFLALGLGIPLAFFLKSRFVTLIGLLSLQVVLAFMFIGNSDYAILTVAAVFGTVIAFESPITMYMILIVAVWFDKSPFGTSHPLRMEFIVGSGLIVGWIFKNILRPSTNARPLHFAEKNPVLLLFLWIFLGYVTWSYGSIAENWNLFKSQIIALLFFLITPLVVRTPKDLKWVVFAWMGIGIIAFSSTVIAPLLGFEATAERAGDAPGTLGIHKNVSAAFMSLSFFTILVAYYWTRGKFRRMLIIITMMSLVGALLYQQSKAGAAALGVVLIVFWIIDTFNIIEKTNAVRILARLFLLLSAIFILVVCVYVLQLEQLLSSYMDLFYSPTSAPTMEFRETQWEAAFDMIKYEDHPVRGLGIGAFMELGPSYDLGSVSVIEEYGIAFHPHNLYIDILLHYGVVGLFLFLWFIISLQRKLWIFFKRSTDLKYKHLYLGLFCGLLAFYLHSILDFAFLTITHYWLYASFAIAAMNIGRNVGEIN